VFSLAFQNCGPKPLTKSPLENTNVTQSVAQGFVEMTEAEAQVLLSPYEGQCATGFVQINTYPLLPINASINGTTAATYKGTAIQKISGSGVITVYNSNLVSNPTVHEVSGFNGNLHFCGINVVTLSNSVNANIVIENASLTSANEAAGNIYIINGEFPNTAFGFKGQIIIKNKIGVYQGRTYF
jgi:hypothetical protein